MTPSDLCDRLRLYVIVDPSMCLTNPVDVAARAIAGGATAIQLRAKDLSDREMLVVALELRVVAPPDQVLFLVNDRLDIAIASQADGVHLGVDDLPLDAARSIAGAKFVIGFSPERDDQATTARALGADYLGVGPVFETTSKLDAGPAIGVDTLTQRGAMSGLPVIGIGGINMDNAPDVLRAGACGIAVMSAVIRDPDPIQATRRLRNAVDEASR